jgi:hypothetical protein
MYLYTCIYVYTISYDNYKSIIKKIHVIYAFLFKYIEYSYICTHIYTSINACRYVDVRMCILTYINKHIITFHHRQHCEVFLLFGLLSCQFVPLPHFNLIRYHLQIYTYINTFNICVDEYIYIYIHIYVYIYMYM